MSKRPSLHDLATADAQARKPATSSESGDSRREKAAHLKKQVPNLDLQKDLPAQYRKKPDSGPASPPATAKSTEARAPKAGPLAPVELRHHRFMKKQFGHPTWCIFAEKFIWGLEKSGYECRCTNSCSEVVSYTVCSMTVSRKFINEAKNTVCGDISKGLSGSQTAREEGIAYTKSKVFTVYLPQGNKKSVLLNPMLPLSKVLEKICFERNINMQEFVAMDTTGSPVPLSTLLGKIVGSEITFTSKAESVGKKRILPPTFEEASVQYGIAANMNESERALGGFKQGLAGFLLPASRNNKRGSRRPDQPKSNASGLSSHQNAPHLVDVSESEASAASPRSDEALTSRLPVTQRYNIGRELGSGAFSVVYEATENSTGETVAIKILDRYEDDDEQAAKFRHEIDIISSLDHENIVSFIELDQDEEHYYVVMELVKAGELFDQITGRGAFESADAALIVAQILKALEYMHSEKTAHRDIKPENILFKDESFKVIKIADFGESKSFKDGMLSTYCGTPDYMAPEIIQGQKYGAEVDMWATGVIAYVMLAGFPPFDGENDVEVFASIMGVRYDFPSPEWDDVPKEAMDFIEAILKQSPGDRLTASQALAHPWIVDNVPEQYRTNKPRQKSSNHSKKVSSTTASEQDSDPVSQSGDGDEDRKMLRLKNPSRSSSRASSLTSKSEPPAEDDFEGHLDKENASRRVMSALKDTQQLAKANLIYMGELVTIEAILQTLKDDPAENLVLPIYWKRLQDIRKVLAVDKKKKKKK